MTTTERLNTITLREAAEGLYRWKAYESYKLGLPFDGRHWQPCPRELDQASECERTWNAEEWLVGTGAADLDGVHHALRSLGYPVPNDRRATVDLRALTERAQQTIDIRDAAAIDL